MTAEEVFDVASRMTGEFANRVVRDAVDGVPVQFIDAEQQVYAPLGQSRVFQLVPSCLRWYRVVVIVRPVMEDIARATSGQLRASGPVRRWVPPRLDGSCSTWTTTSTTSSESMSALTPWGAVPIQRFRSRMEAASMNTSSMNEVGLTSV